MVVTPVTSGSLSSGRNAAARRGPRRSLPRPRRGGARPPRGGQCILTVIPSASAGAGGTRGRAFVSHRRVMQITDECFIFVEYRVPSSSERSYRDLEDAAPEADGRLGPNNPPAAKRWSKHRSLVRPQAVTGMSAESPGMTRRRGIPSGTGDFRRNRRFGS